MKHRKISIFVLEGDISELDFSFKSIRMCDRIPAVFDLWFRIINFHYLFGSCRKALELIHDISHLAHRVCDCPDQTGKCDIISHCEFSSDQKNTSDHKHYNRHKICDTFHIWEEFQPDHTCLLIGIGIITVGLIKFFHFIILSCKSLYHAVSGDILLCIGIHLCKLFP